MRCLISLLPLPTCPSTLTPELVRPVRPPDSRPHPRCRCHYCCCRGQACRPRPRAQGLRVHGGGGREQGWAGAWHCPVGCGHRTCGQRGRHLPSEEAPARRALGPPLPSAGGSGRTWAPGGCSRAVRGDPAHSRDNPTLPHRLPRAAHRFVEVSSGLPQ